jgi:hypothetical protein
MPTVFCFDEGLVEEIGEVIDVPVRPQNYITTTPAIAAVRAAFWHKFLSSKTDTPAPAASRLRKNFYPIDEHGGSTLALPDAPVIPSEVENGAAGEAAT